MSFTGVARKRIKTVNLLEEAAAVDASANKSIERGNSLLDRARRAAAKAARERVDRSPEQISSILRRARKAVRASETSARSMLDELIAERRKEAARG
jgi:hypothetical protein